MAINFIEDVSVAGSVEATTKVITSEVESASTILLDAAADITIDAGGQDIISVSYTHLTLPTKA